MWRQLSWLLILASPLMVSAATRNVPADYATVQAAVNAAQPGDTVLIAAGTYSEDVQSARSGTAGNPIIIDGQNVAIIRSIYTSHKYLDVRNCTVKGKASGWWFWVGKGASYLVLSNNVFDGEFNTNQGLLVRWDNPYPYEYPWGTNEANGCVVISNTFKNVWGGEGNAALTVYGDTNLIYGNTFMDGARCDWLHVWGRTNWVIANLFTNLFWTNSCGNHADWYQIWGAGEGGVGAKGILLESNTVFGGESFTQIGMVEGQDNENICDITFRNNLFVGYGTGFSISAHDVVWYNNTFIDCCTNYSPPTIDGGDVLLFTTATNATYTDFNLCSGHGGRAINNVFLDCGGTNMDRGWYNFETQLTNVQADFNFVAKSNYTAVPSDPLERSVGDPGGWGLQVWWEANGINGGDPKFISEDGGDFRLLTNSPLTGVASPLTNLFTTDKAGTTRGAAWDIGAYEFAGETGTAPTLTSEPYSTNLYAGQGVTFSVVPSGTAPFTYQWKLGGSSISGATTSSYTTNKIKLAANANEYSVAVTNSYGGVVSSNAVLGVTVFRETLPCGNENDYTLDARAIRAYSIAEASQITLVWPTNEYRTEVRIGRRIYTNRPSSWQAWTMLYTNLATASQAEEWTDSTVGSGTNYEYAVIHVTTNVACASRTNMLYADYQYINTGTEIPLVDDRGKVVLLVESGIASSITSELTTLTNDLIGAGFKVYRHDVAASDVTEAGWNTNVTNTKALVAADYATDTNATWTVLIIGHVPVPYSGDSSPGSHLDNLGAHPADWYYADMDGTWTDTTVNDSTSDWPHHYNVPLDGKFDQSTLPSAPEMRVGRIDLRNLPAFGKTEVELLQQYLNRNHEWRHKEITVNQKTLVMSNAVPFEAHSVASGYFGAGDNVDLGAWLYVATNAATSYLFADGKGSGNYLRDWLSGYTTDWAANPFYVPFVTMYGSYYGDWDSAMHTNNIAQVVLANSGYGLAVEYHDDTFNMGMIAAAEPVAERFYAIGHGPFVDASKAYMSRRWWYDGSWYDGIDSHFCFVSLLGDPTLTTRIVAPPTNVVATTNGSDIVLSWTAPSEDDIQGYHVYRAATGNLNAFTRLTTTVTTSPYTNTGGASAAYTYWVRTVKLEDSAQRSYYNASQGVFAEAGGGEPPAASANRWNDVRFRGTTIFR